MLTANQIREFKKLLDERFFEVREEVRLELLDSDDQTYIKLAGQVHDTGEASVADLLVDLQLADINRHINEIRDIDAALMRIAAGTYGVCSYCKATISADRLVAYPTAKRCHRCQVDYEHNYAGNSGSTL
jgi:RNA polymerase-binding transcription factor DksA